MPVTAVAARALENGERFRERRPFRDQAASMHVVAEREERPPRIVAIRYMPWLTTDEQPGRVEPRHTNLGEYGTIFNTLAASCQVTGEMAVEPASAP